GRIDFKGQSLASSLATMLLVCSGIAAFGVGYSMERLSLCFYTYVLGIAVTYMVVLLPWPFFRRNPMVWLARSSNGS
ncbi:microsomal signal peptidase 12kDa subunit, partial [Coemansia spiralis]